MWLTPGSSIIHFLPKNARFKSILRFYTFLNEVIKFRLRTWPKFRPEFWFPLNLQTSKVDCHNEIWIWKKKDYRNICAKEIRDKNSSNFLDYW